MTVPWTRTKEEFESHIDAFASAVNGFAGVRRSRLDMPSGGLPAPFVLFFAYPGSDVIYFPSDAQRTYPLGGEHQLELWVRAKGKRDKKQRVILIDARKGWNHILLLEDIEPFLRRYADQVIRETVSLVNQ
jgi:hypothetical protein